jgi:hypothetical protein
MGDAMRYVKPAAAKRLAQLPKKQRLRRAKRSSGIRIVE